MANEKNLIPLNKRSKEVQREIQKKGREANKKKIQARKTLKEELLLLLSNGDTQSKLSLALLEKAMSGDTKAYEIIRDTIGEKPKDINVNIEQTYEDYIKGVEDSNEY